MPKQGTSFSDEIRQAVRDSGMYMNELAAKIDIKPASMSRFMNHKAGLAMQTLDRLAKILDLHAVKGDKPKGR